MSNFSETFDEAVRKIVAGIPRGQVMSYGEVAKAAGFPRHARMVSRAMSRCESDLPWHRVVKSDRSLAFPATSELYEQQRSLLNAEGVSYINGKVIPTMSVPETDLDALIWGPEEILSKPDR